MDREGIPRTVGQGGNSMLGRIWRGGQKGNDGETRTGMNGQGVKDRKESTGWKGRDKRTDNMLGMTGTKKQRGKDKEGG